MINGEEWEIVFVNCDDDVLYVGNGLYTLGCTIPEIRTIFIANNIHGYTLKNVISHEVSHAEFFSRGLIVPEYVEEVLASIIADNITDVNNITINFCQYTGKC